jgi:hypothetical protein
VLTELLLLRLAGLLLLLAGLLSLLLELQVLFAKLMLSQLPAKLLLLLQRLQLLPFWLLLPRTSRSTRRYHGVL